MFRPADLMYRATTTCAAANVPFVVRKTTESALRGLATDIKEADQIESELSGEAFNSEDDNEGRRVFAERRVPT